MCTFLVGPSCKPISSGKKKVLNKNIKSSQSLELCFIKCYLTFTIDQMPLSIIYLTEKNSHDLVDRAPDLNMIKQQPGIFVRDMK